METVDILIDKIGILGVSGSETRDLLVKYTETICAKQRELCYESYKYHFDGILNESDMYNAIVAAPSVTEGPPYFETDDVDDFEYE